MPQTRITAKNTFAEGLIMDFAPDNTQENVLSNALNATLLTFNGNEMSLQNDMGNCRVESAYLPEGYVPVGTCEFGDIIYIVSYNPLENKSQIGCFPSPERNISNKEISTLVQTLSPSDFTDSNGTVNSYTVKKIVYGNSNINAGDKFIISWGTSGTRNKDQISNFGNTSHNIKATESYWPKLTQVHVVSIEDSGKITYLDDSVKWYGDSGNDFIVSTETLTNDTTTSNIDTYRHALQCQYSVFQSRVAGKLALLLELETINNFSCGHKVIKRTAANTGETLYDIYFSASWESDNYNINPCGMMVTSSTFNHMNSSPSSDIILNTANAVNNLYNPKRVIDFTRLYQQESPGSSYSAFLNNSYYTQVEKYKTVQCETNKDKTAESKTVLRVYETKNGIKSPKTDKSGSGVYVINPSSMKFNSETNQIEYLTVVDDKEQLCAEQAIPDDVIVNTFKKSVLKKVATVVRRQYTSEEEEQKVLQGGKDDYRITYTVCPCMPYGPLTHLSITNTIDFDKAQTGEVNLSIWKYYVNTTSISLTFGFDTYLKEDEDEVIDKVVMEFYDNQGICATYELTGQESYDSKFTEYIELDQASSNFRMSGKKIPDDSTTRELSEQIYHKGSDAEATYADIKNSDEKSSYMYEKDGTWHTISDEDIPGDATKVYINDAGTLYYGRPYIVKIKVYKGTLNELGEIDPSGYEKPLEDARWLWTAPVFNDYYSSETDFKNCQIQTSLDFSSQLDGRGLEKNTAVYTNTEELTPETKSISTLSAQVTYVGIGDATSNKVSLRGQAELSDNFGSALYLDPGTNLSNFRNISIGLALDNTRIETSTSSYETEYSNSFLGEATELYPQFNTDSEKQFEDILLSYGNNLLKKINYTADANNNAEIYSNDDAYQNYKDLFNLSLTVPGTTNTSTDTVTYLDGNGNTKTSTLNFTNTNALIWYQGRSTGRTTTYTTLALQGIAFSKMKASGVETKETSALLVPAIDTLKDLSKYGYAWSSSENIPYQTTILFIGVMERSGKSGWRASADLDYSNTQNGKIYNYYEIQYGDNVVFDVSDTDLAEEYFAKYLNNPFQQVVFGWSNTGSNAMENLEIPGVDCTPLTSVMGPQSVSSVQSRITAGKMPCPQTSNAPGGDYFDGGGSGFFNMPSTLAFYDGEKLWFGGDLRIIALKNQTALSQNFYWKSNFASSKVKAYRTNYAQLIVSLLTQLYVVNEDAGTVPSYTGVAKLKDYTENWKSNIVVKASLVNADVYSFEANKATSAYIKILPKDFTYDNKSYSGINLYYYAKWVMQAAYGTTNKAIEAVGIRNINPVINDSVKCIDFTYQVPYNVSSLTSKFEDSSNLTAKIKVKTPNEKQTNNTTRFTATTEYKSIISPKDSSVLYTYSGGQQVTQFRGSETFNLRTFAVNGNDFYSADIINSDGKAYSLELNSNSNLYKCLKYDGTQVYLENIDKMAGHSSKYTFWFYASGDDPSITGLNKICMFDTSYNIF